MADEKLSYIGLFGETFYIFIGNPFIATAVISFSVFITLLLSIIELYKDTEF